MLNRTIFASSRSQALGYLENRLDTFSFEDRILLYIRARLLSQAEAELFSSPIISTKSGVSLQFLLALGSQSSSKLNKLLNSTPECSVDSEILWFAKQGFLYLTGNYDKVLELGLPDSPKFKTSPWHHLTLANSMLWMAQLDQAEAQRQYFTEEFLPPECTEFDARLALLRGDFLSCLDLLSPLLDSNDGSSLSWELAIHALSQLDENHAARVMLQRACVVYPHNSRLLSRQVLSSVDRRQPIMARRFSLIERLHATESWHFIDKQRSHQNLAYSFENGGRPDLLEAIHPRVLVEGETWQIAGNRALQLASLASPLAPQALQNAQKLLSRDNNACFRPQSSLQAPKLRVGFIATDINYHPVMRFLLMQLKKIVNSDIEYYVIATSGSSDWLTDLAIQIVNVSGSWIDLRGKTHDEQLGLIRDLGLTIAVDLGGWTGNACPSLFASRIAPVQVNYLGFFASSGLPEMNFWLGDSTLFPNHMQEWSSEKIWRLPRCFVAWQPFDELPEGRVDVSAPPLSSDIVFGSFNHVRKLSESTLFLWGRILKAVPGSRLALKAYTSDDPGTSILLRRRMLRCGLDPDSVLWLPTTPSVEEHLQQYGLLDVALDPFPNGGCTTTCEALWMGVPVISLAGSHYVSRMSAAVLTGADLREWIAVSEDDYFEKAVLAATQCTYLRQSRDKLRSHLSSSPLGDAVSLNKSLFFAWNQMSKNVAKQSTAI